MILVERKVGQRNHQDVPRVRQWQDYRSRHDVLLQLERCELLYVHYMYIFLYVHMYVVS